VDVDGDGRRDTVYLDWIEDRGAILGVCTASGQTDEIPSMGMGELLLATDVEPDGRDEILYGGTTISAWAVSVGIFIEGRVQEVLAPDGDVPLTLWDGQRFDLDPETELSIGCEDGDSDGRRELVQVTVRDEGQMLRWTKEFYALEGRSASLITEESGTLPASDENDPADALTSPCDLRGG
jgi:hypothetical protein